MIDVISAVTADPIAMREAYAETLLHLAEENPRVVDLEADLGASVSMNGFARCFPDRFFDMGIQEQNMVSTAAGMAAVGLIPFAHSFGSFITRRACDQIYLSAGYAKCPVKLVGSDPGVCGALNGGTHQSNEDIALMRSVPNIVIVEPADTVSLQWTLINAANDDRLFYIRLQRAENVRLYQDGKTFAFGRANLLRPGCDVTLMCLGSLMADETLKAAEMLRNEGIEARVLDMFTVKPLDTEAVLAAARETGAIVAVENHSIIGGLGSAVAETLAEAGAGVPFARIGIRDRVGEVGTSAELRTVMGMTSADIYAAAKNAISQKR
ncbi:MAG: transketolase family protein [Clostridia bacterium]|nr:transketolase family protein [Clostridia bacterium]